MPGYGYHCVWGILRKQRRIARWDIIPRENTGGSGHLNLRYKSCPEMVGQDQTSSILCNARRSK